MNRREKQEQRAAFEELQKRKKRKLQTSEERLKDLKNPAKSSPDILVKADKRKAENHNRRRKKKRRVHKFGIFLSILQAAVSAVFIGMLYYIGMIPMKYIIGAAAVLAILFLIVFSTQQRRRSRAIGGKLFSLLLIVLMVAGTYNIGKLYGAFGKITNGNYKVDNMVVAVLKSDPAKQLSDAKDYKFGVQYTMGAEDVGKAVEHINKKLGTDIELVVYDSVQEQAEALHDGEVQAIIYNEGYTGNLSEAFEGYTRNVRIIYRYKIKKELDDEMIDMNVNKEPFSVFISGIDVYGAIETNSRSDVNIIATVNPKTHQVLLITTPRDYFIEIPGVTEGEKDKLTHAGIYGVDASMRALEQLYDTEIPFYARVNFTSLIDIVDQLGGVEVYSEYEFTTGMESGKIVDIQAGMNYLNGEEALAFARERHNLPGGDNQRGKNQQAIITGLIKKMMSPQMLVKAGGLFDSVSGNVETNMSKKQMQALIKTQLRKGGGWNIFSAAAEGEGGKDYCYSAPNMQLYVTFPNEESVQNIKDLIDKVENGEILEGSEVAE